MGFDRLEPVHIHVCRGEPRHGAPKWWVGDGKACRADTLTDYARYGLKKSDLSLIESIIINNTEMIISLWKDQFEGNEITFHKSVI